MSSYSLSHASCVWISFKELQKDVCYFWIFYTNPNQNMCQKTCECYHLEACSNKTFTCSSCNCNKFLKFMSF
jgi:hypothetical protein